MLTFLVVLLYSSVTVSAATAKIKLNKTKASVCMGQTLTLKASVTGKSRKVTWASSNKRVAKVSASGKVTPVSMGRAVIAATANGKKATCLVTVYQNFLRLSDFAVNSRFCGINLGSDYLNTYHYLQSGSSTAYYDFYAFYKKQYRLTDAQVVRTLRGITLGRTISDVIRVYGSNYKKETFSPASDKIYRIQNESYAKKGEYYNGTLTLKYAKTVLVYTYPNNTSYAIRFYFNKANKLIAIIYTRNYNSIYSYDSWSKY